MQPAAAHDPDTGARTNIDRTGVDPALPSPPAFTAGADSPEDALARERQALVAWIELSTTATARALPSAPTVAQSLALCHEWKRRVAACAPDRPRQPVAAPSEIQVELPPQVRAHLEALAHDGGDSRPAQVARSILGLHVQGR